MRQTWTLLIWAALAGSVSVAVSQEKHSSTGDSSKSVQELLGKLGHAKFAVRDQAMRDLEELGPAALGALRKAAQSSDAEIRYRAELLVRKAEEQQVVAAVLAPKRLRLQVKDASPQEAITALARQSGYPILLVGDVSTLAARKITLDTGDTTFWEALDQLTAQVGLVEITAPQYTTNGGFGLKQQPGKGPKGGKGKGVVGPGQGSSVPPSGIFLQVGKANTLSTSYVGSVRVRLLRATALGKGETELVLEISAEPRLQDFGYGGRPVMVSARDDQGQKRVGAQVVPDVGVQGNYPMPGNVVVVNGNAIPLPGDAFGQATGTHQVIVRLTAGALPAKGLEELAGKLLIRTQVDAGALVVVDKILEGAGQRVQGKSGAGLQVQAVQQRPNGDVEIKVALDNAPGQAAWGLGGGGNIVIIQGGAQNIQINGNNVIIMGGPNATRQPGSQPPRLLDAQGKSFALVQGSTPSWTLANNQVLYTMTLLYRPQPGQGAPAQLVLPGMRPFTLAVPFKMENIVLR